MINTGNFGSTGKIMLSIKNELEKKGYEVRTAVANSRTNKKKQDKSTIKIGTIVERNFHILLSYLTGFDGYFSVFSTLRFLYKIDRWNPDIIHIHNLHHAYINLPLLFQYINKKNIPVVFTLHDCWTFTGKCPHFIRDHCYKWKTGCHNCKQINKYPSALVDTTKFMYKAKKKWFTSMKHLIVVTPSKWLADNVSYSFLKKYPIRVINNGINPSIFLPQKDKSILKKYAISENKYIIMGVALTWDESKGIDVMQKLQSSFDNEKYQIVLVGVEPLVKAKLDDKIICIPRTDSQLELAKLYSIADVFVNPTREDTFPTVNIEALACGTPIITFDTGGSSEIIDDSCGIVIEVDNINKLKEAIEFVCIEHPFSDEACISRSKEFIDCEKYKEYVSMFEEYYDRVTKM